MNWIELTEIATLEKIKKDSEFKTMIVFKHSTRCSISRMALKNFEADLKHIDNSNFDFYFLDLLQHRDVSNAILD